VLQIKAFTSKKILNRCSGSKVPWSGSILPNWQFSKWHFCTNAWNYFFFNKKVSISSIEKVPLSKNIHGMTQCPPNPGFRFIKVQYVDFLKKPSVDNIFFSSLMFY
jgi:hypothetical protein